MGADEPHIIFLISLPRSGSTMLQAVLATHSEIHSASESWVALAPLMFWQQGACEFNFNVRVAKGALKSFFENANISESDLRDINRQYLLNFYGRSLDQSGKTRFLDKTPRYYEILPELYRVFPDAKYIILHRNPADVFLSILRTWVKDDPEKLFYYKRDLTVAIGKINAFEAENQENVVSLRYEDLVDNPEEQVSSLCSFIGVNYQPGMLNYDKNVSWNYGDKKFLDHKTISKPSGLSDDNDSLNSLHEQFLKIYVQSLTESDCSEFGYAYEGLLARVAATEVTEYCSSIWDCVFESPFFSDFTATRMELRERLRAIEASQKSRLRFWKK